jgi:hypothetical protein
VFPVVTGQLWSLATTTIQVRLRIQMNSILFAKTLVRKDVASSAPPPAKVDPNNSPPATENGSTVDPVPAKDDEDDFSSKAQIMTLMTTDVDRVSDFSWHVFSLVGGSPQHSILTTRVLLTHVVPDSPIEVIIGSIFLYKLLGTHPSFIYI